MISRGEGTRIAAGWLATVLFSAGVAFAQSRSELPCGNLPGVSPEPTAISADPIPSALRPDGTNGSYFRLALVPGRPETPCSVGTADESESTEAPAEARPAVAAVQPPGRVQNVRRADRRRDLE